MFSRLNAWLSDHGTERYNELTHDYKRELFSQLSGRVLEIGAGTGANLAYFPEDVALLALEPNPHMQKYLQKNAEKAGKDIEVHTGKAENIPLSDESVDAVVSTLVLCSVNDQQQSFAEILRVLKPEGTFHFIEHVAAPESVWLHSVQNWVTPCWKCLVDGCRPNRKTGEAIKKSGFKEVQFEHIRLKLPIVGPHIIGSAVK